MRPGRRVVGLEHPQVGVPDVERHRERFGIITFMIVLGGLSELYSVILHGVPSIGALFGLFMTLIYAPLLWLLQRHVARRAVPASC